MDSDSDCSEDVEESLSSWGDSTILSPKPEIIAPPRGQIQPQSHSTWDDMSTIVSPTERSDAPRISELMSQRQRRTLEEGKSFSAPPRQVRRFPSDSIATSSASSTSHSFHNNPPPPPRYNIAGPSIPKNSTRSCQTNGTMDLAIPQRQPSFRDLSGQPEVVIEVDPELRQNLLFHDNTSRFKAETKAMPWDEIAVGVVVDNREELNAGSRHGPPARPRPSYGQDKTHAVRGHPRMTLNPLSPIFSPKANNFSNPSSQMILPPERPSMDGTLPFVDSPSEHHCPMPPPSPPLKSIPPPPVPAVAARPPAVKPLPPENKPLMIDVGAGVSMALRGRDETWKAIEEGRVTITSCISCQIELNCLEDAQLVICPDCTMLSPVDQSNIDTDTSSVTRHGVGVGVKPEEIVRWVQNSAK